MDEHVHINQDNLLIDMVFKPDALGAKPKPEEIQLILASIGEILREVEAAEKRIAEEQNAVSEKE